MGMKDFPPVTLMIGIFLTEERIINKTVSCNPFIFHGSVASYSSWRKVLFDRKKDLPFTDISYTNQAVYQERREQRWHM